MSFPVYSTLQLVARLARLNEIFPVLPAQPLTLRLYQNNVSPDAGMEVGTFVEADYSGYVAANVFMNAPSVNDQGLTVSRSNMIEFPALAGTAPQTIYGIYITDANNEAVFVAQRFIIPQTQGGNVPTAISGIWRTSEPLSSYGWLDVEG